MSLHLSPEEAALFTDPHLFAVKRRTTDKLYAGFEALRLRLKDTGERLQISFPEEVLSVSAKISKGEQYMGCPWVMLDHHRYFVGKDMFAFRVMAWFGHYFSAHFLLGGRYLEASTFTSDHFPGRDIQFSLHPDPWAHAVEPPFTVPLYSLTQDQYTDHISKHQYQKISIQIPTTDLEELKDKVDAFYVVCMQSWKP